MQGLYEHFPSKQELYEEVFISRAESFRQLTQQALAGLAQPLEKLRVLAQVYVNHFKYRPLLLRMFIRERTHDDWGVQSRFGQRLWRSYDEEIQLLQGILETAMAQRLLRPLDPGFLAQFCMGALEASLH